VRLKNKALIGLSLVGLALWFASAPKTLDRNEWQDLAGDVTRGEQVFNIGGCASCHMAKGAKGPERLRLGGGQSFATPFGRFYAPNISPSEAGIGSWNALDLANALLRGVRPDGAHYYPVFP